MPPTNKYIIIKTARKHVICSKPDKGPWENHVPLCIFHGRTLPYLKKNSGLVTAIFVTSDFPSYFQVGRKSRITRQEQNVSRGNILICHPVSDLFIQGPVVSKAITILMKTLAGRKAVLNSKCFLNILATTLCQRLVNKFIHKYL